MVDFLSKHGFYDEFGVTLSRKTPRVVIGANFTLKLGRRLTAGQFNECING
jgi:predicted glycoside hydrolase/deacetylase ChbG (UPF0249 family)